MLFLWIATAAALTGCAAGGSPDSPTGGIALEMIVRGEANLAALYRVDRDGSISFGGGVDARNDRVTWTGSMTAAEIDELRRLLEEYGWFERVPVSTGEPPQRRYRIWLRWPGGRKRYKVRGSSPDITPIHDHLERVARRRLGGDPVIQALPRPSAPP